MWKTSPGVESLQQHFTGIFPRKLIFPGAVCMSSTEGAVVICRVLCVPWVAVVLTALSRGCRAQGFARGAVRTVAAS